MNCFHLIKTFPIPDLDWFKAKKYFQESLSRLFTNAKPQKLPRALPPGPPPGLCPWTPPGALEWATGPHAVRRSAFMDSKYLLWIAAPILNSFRQACICCKRLRKIPKLICCTHMWSMSRALWPLWWFNQNIDLGIL